MPSDASAGVIFGAILGVLGTIGILFAVVSAVDGRYVTRREYDQTLVDINRQLTEIRGIETSRGES